MFLDANTFEVGDRMLWLCVLRRTVFDYVLYKGSGKHKLKWQQANAFIFPLDEDDAPCMAGLTFDEICALFSWEPDYLRRLTKELKREDIRKLESTKFRDEIDDLAISNIERMTWSNVKAPTPFLTPQRYNDELKRVLAPKVVNLAEFRALAPLRRQWHG